MENNLKLTDDQVKKVYDSLESADTNSNKELLEKAKLETVTFSSWITSSATHLEDHWKEQENNKMSQNNKMTIISPYLPINTLNISGLNFLIKRHNMAEWI